MPARCVPLSCVGQPCHRCRATSRWGCAGTLGQARLCLQSLRRAALATDAAGVSGLLWGQGFAAFPKHLRGSWHATARSAPFPCRVTGQLRRPVASGRGMVQILPVQSRQAITGAEMVPSLLLFFPITAPSVFLKEKNAYLLIVFLEEQTYLRSKFL